MNNTFKYIICSFAAIALVSCTEQPKADVKNETGGHAETVVSKPHVTPPDFNAD